MCGAENAAFTAIVVYQAFLRQISPERTGLPGRTERWYPWNGNNAVP